MRRYFMNEIYKSLDYLLDTDPTVILLGEDIEHPFGGCFKVTKDLSKKYPGRVINTPISEAAIIGTSIGLALKGFKPIPEIMFYDFMTLCTDQLVNHAMAFKDTWNISPNITIRTTIGKKDYGVTHSKDLDYIYKNVLKIYHPTPNDDVYEMLINAVLDEQPVLFVEDSKYYKEALK